MDNKQFTSHLAEKTRELCIPAIGMDEFVGVRNKQIIFENQKTLKINEVITLDANSGRIFKTKKSLVEISNKISLKELVNDCKDHLNSKFICFDDNLTKQDDLVDSCFWNSENLLKECISDQDKLKILFQSISGKDLIKIKNNLRDKIEDKIMI